MPRRASDPVVLRKFTSERVRQSIMRRGAPGDFVVQPAHDRRGDHLRVFGKAMTDGRERIRVGHRLGNAGAQAGVWTTSIVVGHPFTKGPPEMGLVHRDQPIETLPTYCADQSLAA